MGVTAILFFSLICVDGEDSAEIRLGRRIRQIKKAIGVREPTDAEIVQRECIAKAQMLDAHVKHRADLDQGNYIFAHLVEPNRPVHYVALFHGYTPLFGQGDEGVGRGPDQFPLLFAELCSRLSERSINFVLQVMPITIDAGSKTYALWVCITWRSTLSKTTYLQQHTT